MIKCVFCGNCFNSVEEYEKHIDDDCRESTQPSIGTQAIYPDGTSKIESFDVAEWLQFLPDEFLHDRRNRRGLYRTVVSKG